MKATIFIGKKNYVNLGAVDDVENLLNIMNEDVENYLKLTLYENILIEKV
jgi:hypothetical protein